MQPVIVADTNLIGYLMIDGPRIDIVRRLWYRDHDWKLPALWRSEFLNLLATRMRAGKTTSEEAHSWWQPHFVAAAIKLNVPLVTADKPLLAACPDLALSPDSFLQL